MRQRHRDRARSRSHIHKAHHAIPRHARQHRFHQVLRLRPRNQHRRAHPKAQPPELLLTKYVLHRLVLRASLQQLRVSPLLWGRHKCFRVRQHPCPIPSQHMPQQQLRIAPRLT